MRIHKSVWILNRFVGLAGLGGVIDGWDGDEEAALAPLSDMGQPIIRKGLKSLPPMFSSDMAPRQLVIGREGSNSLPLHLDCNPVVPGSESAAPLPTTGVYAPATAPNMMPAGAQNCLLLPLPD